jgi:WD40 repeat protein
LRPARDPDECPLFHLVAAEKERANELFGYFGRAFERYAIDILRCIYPNGSGLLDMRIVPELWNTAVRAIFQSKTHAVLKGHTSAFSPDGRRVATASAYRTARLWDAETGTEIAVLKGHEDAVLSAVFSPDGRRVATASEDKTARLWDAETGTEIAVLRGHEGWVSSAAFSPDGRRVSGPSFAATLGGFDDAVDAALPSAASLLASAPPRSS